MCQIHLKSGFFTPPVFSQMERCMGVAALLALVVNANFKLVESV